MIRLIRLHSMPEAETWTQACRWWWLTRKCDHSPSAGLPSEFILSQMIDGGMRKMFWCARCERTWFS